MHGVLHATNLPGHVIGLAEPVGSPVALPDGPSGTVDMEW